MLIKKKIFIIFLTKGVLFLKLVQTFSGNMYSQYCDCAKFIYAVEPLEVDSDDNNSAQEGSSKVIKKPSKSKSAYLITRGVEILDAEGGKIGKYY